MTAPKLWSDLTAEVHDLNQAKGWFDAERDRTFGESVFLIHSEASEIGENYRSHRLNPFTNALGKPDDVPSEFADVLIRVLDLAHRAGWVLGYLLASEAGTTWTGPHAVNDPTPVEERMFRLPFPDDLDVSSFGDNLTWLHRVIAELRADRPYTLARVVFCLVTLADRYSIDLTAEYERKMAYNWTRKPLHGGRTMRDDR